MRAKLFAALLSAVLVFSAPCSALAAVFSISDAENSALEYSPKVKALAGEQKAYEQRAQAQKTQVYPRFYFDGSYKYATHVQEISLPMPGVSLVKFGDNTSYSIGPLFNWTAWDFGAINSTYKSARAAAQAKKEETEAARRQVLLSARSAYFQVALADEQIKLYSDALRVSNAQYEDIRLNVRAGTKSLADELKSHQEVISRKKQLRQAQADMTAALRDLSAVTGRDHNSVELESIDSMITKFERFASLKLNENHPSLAAYRKYAEASEYSGRSAGSSRYPKIQVSAKSSVEYPDGSRLESYNQNAFTAYLNMPLFESGASKNRIKENENSRVAALKRGEQLLADMRRDWDKTVSQLANLQDQKELNDISVSETEQLAQIIYKTYKTGSISFIEVENANFKALEAKIQAARTKVQILMNLAVLAGMAE